MNVPARLAFALALLLVLSGALYAQDDKPEKSDRPARKKMHEPTGGFGKGRAETGGAKAEDAEAEDEPSGEAKDEDSKAEKEDARKGDKPEQDEAAKQRELLKRKVTKALGRKEKAWLVVTTLHRTYSKADPKEAGRRGPKFQVDDEIQYHVFDGKDAAVEELVEFLAKYPPEEKKRRRGKDKDAEDEVPKPERDFEVNGRFDDDEQGHAQANELVRLLKARYDERQKALKEREKAAEGRGR